MLQTFGSQPTTMPAGFFKAVSFPTLTVLDTATMDHRLLSGAGAGVRDLPLSIKFASKTSAMGGHDTAEVSGALFEVTIDVENKKMSGKGFLLADDNGRRHARLIHTGAMRGNSVDLTEVRAKYVESLDSDEWWIEFSQFKIGTTTGVATPAFGEARIEIEPLSDDELVASFGDDPMNPLVVEFEEFYATIPQEPTEIVASGALTAPFEAFFMPEADRPTKIIVTSEGLVFGHLALWDSCHDGYSDKCLIVPRPRDGYASFNKAGVLTERGQIETGPIFAFGGHRSAKSAPTIAAAYGGIENAWCDVRAIEGKLGPWVSGTVRPGVSEEVVYAARASRISGHWVNGALKAIVSVNAEGYDVPGFGPEAELVAGFAFEASDDCFELVASFPECAAEATPTRMTFDFSTTSDLIGFVNNMNTNGNLAQFTSTITTGGSYTVPSKVIAPPALDELQVWADELLADLLTDERDGDLTDS